MPSCTHRVKGKPVVRRTELPSGGRQGCRGRKATLTRRGGAARLRGRTRVRGGLSGRRETARRERGRTDDAGELVDLALGAAEGSELCVETVQNESARAQGEGKHARLSARRRPPCLVLLHLVGPTSRPALSHRRPPPLFLLHDHAQPHNESRSADVRASWSACEPSCPASARGWVSSPSPQLDTGSEGTDLGVADQLHDATLVRGEAGNLSHEERVSSSRGTAQESERDDAPRGRST